MNRTERKRRKIRERNFQRKYGSATYPFWKNQSVARTCEQEEQLAQAMADVYHRCLKGLRAEA